MREEKGVLQQIPLKSKALLGIHKYSNKFENLEDINNF
jgi:hypothetical protein